MYETQGSQIEFIDFILIDQFSKVEDLQFTHDSECY